MFNSQILDVAIGMIFVYLLLSLICSAANELIEAWLKNRAKDLEAGICNLVGDDLAGQLYGHGLIKGLFSNAHGKPSYIPSKTFALSLMNIIAPNGVTPVAAGPAAGAQAVAVSPVAPNTLAQLRVTIAGLPTTDAAAASVQKAILALIDDAQGDINKLKSNIEGWYDSAMDRVSGWYKRRTQTIILFLGLVIAVALNADSAYIARHLSADPALRNSLVSAAQVYAQKENPGSSGKPSSDQGGNTGSQESTRQSSDSAQERFNDNLKQIRGLGLPLGWNVELADPKYKEAIDPHLKWPGLQFQKASVLGEWYQQIRFHWLGWILTAIAISLGAPFWFDTLNKFIVVRSTVKPREKSQDEPSKD
jgi:hypothetical protein